MTIEKLFDIARKSNIDQISMKVDEMSDNDIFEALVILQRPIAESKNSRKKELTETMKEIHCM